MPTFNLITLFVKVATPKFCQNYNNNITPIYQSKQLVVAHPASFVNPFLPAFRQWSIHIIVCCIILQHLLLLLWIKEPLIKVCLAPSVTALLPL